MAKALKQTSAATQTGAGATQFQDRARDWRKSMSDNVAYALVVYTALHIFLTVGAMKETGIKSMALFALVVLVVGIIPACRRFEKRWRDLNDSEASDPALSGAFRRDQILVWLMALGLPFALTVLFKLIGTMG
ncbi:hypothetical protein [Pontixanthobacter sp.]|uniref:hypothetical protein n=1 Tax=Pontixanthobacter sp. TaxID=2792078 RepID=UPI003C7A3D95